MATRGFLARYAADASAVSAAVSDGGGGAVVNDGGGCGAVDVVIGGVNAIVLPVVGMDVGNEGAYLNYCN